MIPTDNFKELTGMVIDRIKDIICAIYECDQRTPDISLFYGDTGVLLLQLMLVKLTDDPKQKASLQVNIDDVLDKVENAEVPILPTYAEGLAGVGCVVHFLSLNQAIDIDDDMFFEDIDLYLKVALNKTLSDKDFDPLHGAVGIALYFLKRKKYDIVSDVIRVLLAECERVGPEVRWSSYNNNVNKQVYDLGVAHGMAGITHFLTLCHRDHLLPNECREMITGSILFYLNNMQDLSSVGSYYSNFISCENIQGNRPEWSRLAWCYGDLGILYTLFCAAKEIGNISWQQKFESMLENTANRKQYESTYIDDASFCHGSAGAGIIFLLLYIQTKNEKFRTAYEYWEVITTEFVQELVSADEGFAIFSHNQEVADAHKKGLYTGLAGIGMFLLASRSCTKGELILANSWKDFLLL